MVTKKELKGFVKDTQSLLVGEMLYVKHLDSKDLIGLKYLSDVLPHVSIDIWWNYEIVAMLIDDTETPSYTSGTKVRIISITRSGDCGITNNLSEKYISDARTSVSNLCDFEIIRLK